jgi:hypothetical protein
MFDVTVRTAPLERSEEIRAGGDDHLEVHHDGDLRSAKHSF